MRIIGDTNIPFLSYRRVALSLSLLVILAGLAYESFGPGLNMGIDFEGGTQVTIKLAEPPDLARLRTTLSGLESGEVFIQRFDEAAKHEVLIRVRNPEGAEGDFSKPILDLLHQDYNSGLGNLFDLNTKGAKELADKLETADPDLHGGDRFARLEHYQPMADAVLEYRKKEAIYDSVDRLDTITALSDGVRTFLKDNSAAGAFSLLGTESVGPAVGADLRKKALLAIVFALAGMLIYIWIRFQLPYGIGAVAALFHDVLITLSALALTHREINLPTIGALLTLVGYSVNDSVVVFDRVRENLRLNRGEKLEGLMDRSINQTLSRTFITSGTTLVVVATLYIFGGDVINTFAFVLLIGISVGTYSSIFVASPVALWVSRAFVAYRAQKRTRGR